VDLPWGDDRSNTFVTNIGLVTSDGPCGPNVMACEWTYHISYRPGLIAVCIRPQDATHENIQHTKEFGVNLCATDQSVMSSLGGGYTGKQYDKVSALKELGWQFYQAKQIKAPMITGAAMNAECRVVQASSFGDHTMFVGEIVEASHTPEQGPLAYHSGKYWLLEKNVAKPSDEERTNMSKIVETHKKPT